VARQSYWGEKSKEEKRQAKRDHPKNSRIIPTKVECIPVNMKSAQMYVYAIIVTVLIDHKQRDRVDSTE
jgi:hypothetical protein